MSAKRATQLAEYRRNRLIFLAAHPVCQWWLAMHGFSEMDLTKDRSGQWAIRIEHPDLSVPIAAGSRPMLKEVQFMPCPLATEVHHKNKRRGSMLLDERFWMALSEEGHDWIELHKHEARRLGFLLNF